MPTAIKPKANTTMNLDYQVGEPLKELESLRPHYAAHNQLMANMQLCGTFSDKLIERVYSLSCRALYVRIDQKRGMIENDKADEILHKLYDEFVGLFNAYNIFSNEFKSTTYGLFHAICFLK